MRLATARLQCQRGASVAERVPPNKLVLQRPPPLLPAPPRSSVASSTALAMAAASNGPRLGVTDPILVAPPSALDTTLSNALESDLRQRGLYESNEEAVHREEARLASRLAVGCFGCRGEDKSNSLSVPPGPGAAGHARQGLGAQSERRQGDDGPGRAGGGAQGALRELVDSNPIGKGACRRARRPGCGLTPACVTCGPAGR